MAKKDEQKNEGAAFEQEPATATDGENTAVQEFNNKRNARRDEYLKNATGQTDSTKKD